MCIKNDHCKHYDRCKHQVTHLMRHKDVLLTHLYTKPPLMLTTKPQKVLLECRGSERPCGFAP